MTYSLGDNLSGVGVYSQKIGFGLAAAHPEKKLLFCYRPHRYLLSLKSRLPANVHRRLLRESAKPPAAGLFHGLNQRLPRMRFRRTVSTFHDLFVLTGDYSTPEYRQRFAALARDAAARSDRIIAVSQFTASQVEQLLGVDRSRIHVVHHGVEPVRPLPLKREKLILHVGAIQRRKNIGRLVKAFEAVGPDWRLALAGSAGFGASEIVEQIERSPCRNRIRVLGYLPPEQLTALYSRAQVFAFPSLDEGFGMPVLEAMTAGIPVLASNCSALPEVCEEAALLVDPEKAEAIAEGLRCLTEDQTLRTELIEAGFRRAAQFTWKKAVQKTWDAYHRLA